DLPMVIGAGTVTAQRHTLVVEALLAVGSDKVVSGPREAVLWDQPVCQGISGVAGVVAVGLDHPLVVAVGDRDVAFVDTEGVGGELGVVIGADPGHAQPDGDALFDPGWNDRA